MESWPSAIRCSCSSTRTTPRGSDRADGTAGARAAAPARGASRRRRMMAERSRQSVVSSDQSVADRHLRAADRPAIADGRLPTDLHRVVIEHLSPEIDAGRFPIKRTVGEHVEVGADVFADGHDVLTVLLRDRHVTYSADTAEHPEPDLSASSASSALNVVDGWRETSMTMIAAGTDRWTGRFAVEKLGWHEYQVVGWVDRFRSWRRDLEVKAAAGQDVLLELLEGSMLIR